MSASQRNKKCEEIAPLFVFYLCDEVEPRERRAVEEHIATCETCRKQFAEEAELEVAIESIPQEADRLDPGNALLLQMRSELAERLDDLASPPVKETTLRFAWFRRWMILHPVWSGAALVAMGLVLGTQSTQWLASRNGGLHLEQAVNVRPGVQFTEDQLSRMAVAGINFTPSPTSGKQNVRLQLSAEQPVILTGNLDDENVRQVLTYVVKSGDRFDPGLRLDCVDILKSRVADKDVRGALVAAARKDENPAVRLKALEALRDSSQEPQVRAALLEALQHDTNPGVRVEAVNLLVRSLDDMNLPMVTPVGAAHPDISGMAVEVEPDQSMADLIHTLEELRQSDPNRYVRLRSSAALRQISARSEH